MFAVTFGRFQICFPLGHWKVWKALGGSDDCDWLVEG